MKKEYLKPDVELVSLIAQEEITSDDIIDGDMDLESNDMGW